MAAPKTIDAVYEEGVLKPLVALDLEEHQRVRLTIDVPPREAPDEALRAWTSVYEGLGDDEIDAVEAVAFDRRSFMNPSA